MKNKDQELKDENPEIKDSSEATKDLNAENKEELKSDEKDMEEKEAEDDKNNSDEIDLLSEKNKELNDKYLRLYSEFDNFRKRTAKEKLDLLQTAGQDVILDLLTILDDFERAIASNQNSEDLESLREGFVLIYTKLKRSLENKGLKGMDSMGKEFDTDVHEAITNIPAPSEDLKGKVVDVAEKGYYFKDKILRYAKVVVGQ